MPKCPWCGSTAQVRELETEYLEDGWSIEVRRHSSAAVALASSTNRGLKATAMKR